MSQDTMKGRTLDEPVTMRTLILMMGVWFALDTVKGVIVLVWEVHHGR